MIPFSPPYINDDIINEVVDSLNSGWITTGPKVKLLEDSISKFVNIPNVLCVNSWTSAAIMVLRWYGIKEGDEVIIPAYTYSATALAVIHAGGKPIMVDIGEDFNISIKEISKAITTKTKAIIPVDFGGYPCDYHELNQLLATEKIQNKFSPSSLIQEKLGRILTISDAAHSLGASYNGTKTANNTDFTIFSLHAVKNVTTAEGGAIAINMPEPFDNSELYIEMRRMSLNCQTKDAFSKAKAGSWRYDIIGLGMKINMADINAAIGLGQMRIYNELLKSRKHIFEKYIESFKQFSWAILPPYKSDCKESSYHIFPLRIKGFEESDRDNLITEVSENGVAVNVHFIPLPLLTYFKENNYQIENYPVAYQNYKNEVSLPIYPQLTESQIIKIVETIVNAYNFLVKND